MKVRKIIAGLVFVSTSLFAIHKCDGLEDLKIYNGHYYGVTSNTFTFDEAKKFATAYNGYLAIPNNAAENNYIKSLIGGRSSAWLGIYDASNSDNYCYTETGCTSTPSRFKDINNTSLSYTNWQVNEPNNYVHSFDVYDGKQMVSPLGEHWVVINGDNGRWYDVGNHIKDNNNPIRHRALIEFNTTPTCYEAPSNITDTFTNSKCNTKLYDTTTDLVENGQTLDCQTDTYNNTYCPSALAECAEQWDYDNGYSVSGVGQVVDYTNKVEVTGGGCGNVFSDCATSTMTYSSAESYCANLNEGDISTWRLPTLSEAQSGLPSCGGLTWTSSSGNYPAQYGPNRYAWNGSQVSYFYINYGGKSYVRCIK